MPVVINGTTGIETPGVDADPGSVLAQTLTVNSNNISAVNSLGFRNRIINGDMRIDQRNAGASVSVNGNIFTVDRFYGSANASGIFSAQRSTVAPSGFTNSVALTVTTARASIASTDVYGFRQAIEGFNTADLGFGTASAQSITLSFWVRSSITGTYAVAFWNNAFNRNYVATYSISAANTWEQKTITLPGDTTGTWLTDNGAGLTVYWDLGSGSNYNGSAGSWSGSGIIRTSGSTNWISTNGATFFITGVQLEAGTVATPFERRPYGTELAMCQRYFFRAVPFTGTGVGTGSTLVARARMALPVTMRSSPTLSLIGAPPTYNGGGVGTLSSISATWSSTNTIELDGFASTTFGGGDCLTFYNNGDNTGVSASAEL